MHIAIIGAGAAGCFAAIHLKNALPDARVSVYESLGRALAKVSITGGGRCNLTNSFAEVNSLSAVYPRGARLLQRLFRRFNHDDACRWFEANGVRLVTQSDQCVFPRSQNAREIVDTLLRLMNEAGVALHTGQRVANIEKAADGGFRIAFCRADFAPVAADAVVVTTGGSPRASGLSFLKSLALDVVPPVPSLFSLCVADNELTKLTGTVVEAAATGLAGTKIHTRGPLLITHRGVSGPAVLKLSAHAARLLAEADYRATIVVNWLGDAREQEAAALLADVTARHTQKQLRSIYPPALNSRLWCYLLCTCGLRTDMRWGELGRKGLNRLAAALTAQQLKVTGRNRFKEEFVTCGGISLAELDPATLESRRHEGLYFAGEVMDIDGVTGGFNLQAAWTTGYVAAQGIIAKANG